MLRPKNFSCVLSDAPMPLELSDRLNPAANKESRAFRRARRLLEADRVRQGEKKGKARLPDVNFQMKIYQTLNSTTQKSCLLQKLVA